MANALPAAAQALVAATMTGSTGAASATGAVPLNAASLHEFEVESMANALPTQAIEMDTEAQAEVAPAEEAAASPLQLQQRQGATSPTPTTSTSP